MYIIIVEEKKTSKTHFQTFNFPKQTNNIFTTPSLNTRFPLFFENRLDDQEECSTAGKTVWGGRSHPTEAG